MVVDSNEIRLRPNPFRIDFVIEGCGFDSNWFKATNHLTSSKFTFDLNYLMREQYQRAAKLLITSANIV